MTTFVVLLRAVNLASHNRVAMAELRALVEGVGAEDVRTYVQSGNVVCRSSLSADRLARAVHDGIVERLGLDVTVVVRTRAALAKVRVPTLIAHGRNDALILPAAAEMTAAAIRGSRISWYDDCGHSPFIEHPERFNRELDAFVSSLHGR